MGLSDYSNIQEAQRKAYNYLGKNGVIYPSTHKDKKYMVYNPDTGKYVHFGQYGYEDHTKHRDEKRRGAYLARATKIRGNWANDKYSPNNLSIHILW